MPRNPNWTASNAATTISSDAWMFPDGTLNFSPDPTAKSFDSIGTIGGQFAAGESIDFILVNLTSDSTYTFVAKGSYQVNLSIYDNDGYLLQFTDGDDAGFSDQYLTDSIVSFKPDYTGIFRLSIAYANVKDIGVYGISGVVDYFSNEINDLAPEAINTAASSILRSANTGAASPIIADFNSGKTSYHSAIGLIIAAADATTSVATMNYQFFTGKIPSQGGIDYLVSPTGPNPNNLNSAYYQSFNLENRYINFAVNLGKIGEGNAKFTNEYGSLSLFEATRKAYGAIFGGTPNDAKVQALLSGGRDLYFEAYGKDGLNGIGTKAAMVGWLLAEAEKGDLGVMARSNAAWLTDLSDGSAPFAIDILAPSAGYYKSDFVFGGN